MARLFGWLVVLFAVIAAIVLVVVPRATGGTTLTVLSGSMSPQIPAGSVVAVRPVDPQTVEPGDVITYQVRPDEATYVTHRVVSVEGDTFVTKGDANARLDDDPVPPGMVRGKVWLTVPYLGHVAQFAVTPLGLVVTFLAVSTVFGIGDFRESLRKRRHQEGPWSAKRNPVKWGAG